MSTENIIYAFILTILTGLYAVLGVFLIFWIKTTCTRFLSFGLGLSAGIMIYLSFFELLKESNHLLTNRSNASWNGLVIVMFLAGLALAGIMVYISFNELLPTARRYSGHMSLFGLFCSMVLTTFNLYLLR